MHYFGFSFGNIQAKEENLIPKVHSGLINMISYRYEIQSSLYKLLEFNLGYGTMKTEIENETVSFNARAWLSYSFGIKLINDENFKYFLGPVLSYSSSLSEYRTFDEAHLYWANFLSLGVSNVGLLNIDSDKYFILKFNFSVFGIYTRPEYNRLYANEYWTFSSGIDIMNSHYKFGFVNNAFQLKTFAEYRTKLWGDNYLSLGLSIFYSRIKAEDGKPLKELIPGLTLGVIL